MPTLKKTSKKAKEKVKLVTPQMLIQSHEQTVAKSLKAHNLVSTLIVHFPNRKRTPLLAQLGVWLVNRAGGIIVTKYRFDDTITSKESPTKE